MPPEAPETKQKNTPLKTHQYINHTTAITEKIISIENDTLFTLYIFHSLLLRTFRWPIYCSKQNNIYQQTFKNMGISYSNILYSVRQPGDNAKYFTFAYSLTVTITKRLKTGIYLV